MYEEEEIFDKPTIHVGKLEKAENSIFLTSPYFPSKIGGIPAWLDPVHLPSSNVLCCPICKETMSFLLQVYAASDVTHAFHRIIYVFVCIPCKNQFCSLRCQLPKINNFYSIQPPQERSLFEINSDNKSLKTLLPNNICSICSLPTVSPGILHKRCQISNKYQTLVALFDEFIISIEDTYDEEEEENLSTVVDLSHEAHLLRKYKREEKKNPDGILDNSEAEAFEEIHLDHNKGDEKFTSFLTFCNLYPGHVIRYSRDGDPLWFSTKNILNDLPPACSHCGSERHFEFQIQPSLIPVLVNTLQNQPIDIDFGIVAVYTCSADCEASELSPYLPEFTYVQPDSLN